VARVVSRGFVYVARSASGDLYKIGYSENPRVRIAGLKRGGGEVFTALAIVKGTRAMEDCLHIAMRRWSLGNEYYARNEALADLGRFLAGEITLAEAALSPWSRFEVWCALRGERMHATAAPLKIQTPHVWPHVLKQRPVARPTVRQALALERLTGGAVIAESWFADDATALDAIRASRTRYPAAPVGACAMPAAAPRGVCGFARACHGQPRAAPATPSNDATPAAVSA
jgi:hypothetical protein